MKILIGTFNFPPAVGGVEEVARTQAAGFAARGHEVTVATSRHPDRKPADVPPGVRIEEFEISGGFLAGQGFHGELARYQNFIAQAAADVILLHAWQSWNVEVALPVLPRSSAKKILVSHGFDAHLRKASPRFPWGFGSWFRARPYVWQLPRKMKMFDRLIFLSARRDTGKFYDALLASAACPERVTVIPNGVHLGEFRRTRPSFRKTYGVETKFLILNVANYFEGKNQIATLHDFMQLNRGDTTLVFIGSEFNEYHTELLKTHSLLQARFPKARVLFLEKIPKEAVYAAYQAADIFLLSTKFETQPLSILDAMAAGVPFVCTSVGCVPELPGGIVADAGAAATAALRRLLDDANQRQELGRQGREACETTYDWERVLDAYEKLFMEMRQ